MDYAVEPESGDRVGEMIDLGQLTTNQRVRATISWNGCSDDASGVAPGTVGVDYDLFLYNATTETYVWGSQSLHDVNEGFDFTIQTEGTYELWISWLDGDRSCEDTEIEPLALTLLVW
jgi:hypothetical protein